MRWPHAIALLAAIGVIVLLLFAPRTPEVPERKAETYEDKLEKALTQVENSPQPMQGILALRELAEDSTRAEADWHLGRFAIQTGQYDRAIPRFEKVVQLEGDSVPETYSYLATAHLATGDTSAAIEDLIKYKTLIEDTVLILDIERFLIELKDKSEENAERKEEEKT